MRITYARDRDLQNEKVEDVSNGNSKVNTLSLLNNHAGLNNCG